MTGFSHRLRRARWSALAVLGVLAAVSQLPAQDRVADPVVLVLNILSSTHARPATGIVVSASGQVLVPADFVGRGDEILILEGGTNLDRNGLATRTEARSRESGLAVVSSDALNRPHFTLAATAPRDGDQLAFMGFPPADALANGAPPIRETVAIAAVEGIPTISPASPLPNINGALIDQCGSLAGVVLADGEPSMLRDAGPAVLWVPELTEALTGLGVDASTGGCAASATAARAAESVDEAPSSGPVMLDPATLRPAAPDLALAAPVPAGSDQAGARSTPAQGADLPPSEPVNDGNMASGAGSFAGTERAGSHIVATDEADTPSPRYWLFAVMLAALAGWWLGRGSRRERKSDTVTVPLAPAEGSETPFSNLETPGLTGISIHITFPDGREDMQHPELADDSPSLLLGSGHTDLVIDHRSVDRTHGQLRMLRGQLVYSDIGSRHGSWINGVACLEGERFVLGPEDKLRVGEVILQVAAIPPGPAQE